MVAAPALPQTSAALLCLVLTGALSAPYSNWNSLFTEQTSDAGRRVTSSTSNNNNSPTGSTMNNYSVSFVPLFSVLANLIPRFFGRFNHVSNAARNIDVVEATKNTRSSKPSKFICTMRMEGRHRDPNDVHQFYLCEPDLKYNQRCSTLINARSNDMVQNDENTGLHTDDSEVMLGSYRTGCFAVKIFRCRRNFVYSDDDKRCIPENG
ncbi:uncharacterized protein LOC126480810 [Schistocerca serialis cubense]|uniref:uncharacterized protein LOC126480810 n=1 Tax=Schistocerca serialis cubense TaxID=2023355 RepID=UPI00214EA466|nr:uncharacterized protein LOC126480810 [Schistocerca serialis cubense]